MIIWLRQIKIQFLNNHAQFLSARQYDHYFIHKIQQLCIFKILVLLAYILLCQKIVWNIMPNFYQLGIYSQNTIIVYFSRSWLYCYTSFWFERIDAKRSFWGRRRWCGYHNWLYWCTSSFRTGNFLDQNGLEGAI